MSSLAQSAALRSYRRTYAREVWSTLRLGWPLVVSQVAQMAITTTDVVMMGWLGPRELGAGALGGNVYVPLLMIGIGLGVAVSALVSQVRGANPHAVRDVRRSARQGFWATTAVSLPALAILWNTSDVLVALGQDPSQAEMAGEYMRAMMWGFLPAIWFITLRAFLSSMERTGAVLVVTLLAIVLNAASNWVFMFGHLGAPRLELVGAGISSTLANSFMFLALLGYCYADRRLRRYHIAGRFWRPDWARLTDVFRIGAPISMTLLFEVGAFNASVFIAGTLGEETLAAHAIALQIASATFMVPLGLSQATTVRVGLSAGRGDAGAVTRAGWTSIALVTAFMGLTAAFMIGAPQVFVRAFIDPVAAPQVAALAASFLMVAGVFQIVDGIQVAAAACLRGLKDTRVAMVMAGFGYWVIGLPLGVALAFGAGLGGVGIWIGLAGGLATVAGLLVWRWIQRERLGLV